MIDRALRLPSAQQIKQQNQFIADLRAMGSRIADVECRRFWIEQQRRAEALV